MVKYRVRMSSFSILGKKTVEIEVEGTAEDIEKLIPEKVDI